MTEIKINTSKLNSRQRGELARLVESIAETEQAMLKRVDAYRQMVGKFVAVSYSCDTAERTGKMKSVSDDGSFCLSESSREYYDTDYVAIELESLATITVAYHCDPGSAPHLDLQEQLRRACDGIHLVELHALRAPGEMNFGNISPEVYETMGRQALENLVQAQAAKPADVGMTFVLTEEQRVRANEWQRAMLAEHPADSGAVGGRFQFLFTVTSIGDCCEVRDKVSGTSLDITDTSDW